MKYIFIHANKQMYIDQIYIYIIYKYIPKQHWLKFDPGVCYFLFTFSLSCLEVSQGDNHWLMLSIVSCH